MPADALRLLLVQQAPYAAEFRGASEANRRLLEALAARGHACRVLTTSSTTAVAGADACMLRNGVEVRVTPPGPPFWGEIAAQVETFEPTWLLVSDDESGGSLAAALDVAPARVVYVSHSQATLPFGPDSFWPDERRGCLLARTAAIVSVSKYVRQYIKLWGGLDSLLLRFPAYRTPPYPWCGRRTNRFVTMINPSVIKGLPIFLEMARQLPDVRFAAVPTWATTQADLAALQRLPNVTIMPPSADLDELFGLTRALLVPSLWGEAFGHIVVDAMVRGVPFLASAVGGLPEAKLGVDYVLPVRPIAKYEQRLDARRLPVAHVPDQDVSPWTDALSKLIEDAGQYEQISAASRAAATAFVSRVRVETAETVFRSLDAGQRRSKPAVSLA
jgi:glycosyltransferase involved in cell wall biosynthesis